MVCVILCLVLMCLLCFDYTESCMGIPNLLTDAEKRLLANALLDFSNERFVLLSEKLCPRPQLSQPSTLT